MANFAGGKASLLIGDALGNDKIIGMNKIFDSIRQMDKAGQEYWSARELASVIGYADYRNFSKS